VSQRPGRLSLVGTPIGNLEDLSPRARRTLAEADRIAAEDTRRAAILLGRFDIRRPVMSCFHANEARRAGEICARIREGAHVALITDAGMPAVSDPGYRIVRACLDAALPVEVIPGPSAVLAALAGSGLPSDEFRFVGFLPRAAGKRRARLAALRADPATLVLFEAPNRLTGTLSEIAEAFVERRAVVARELTKVHEEFVRGSIADLRAHFDAHPPKGEVTLVVEGAPAPSRPDGPTDALSSAIADALAAGATPRDIYRAAVETARVLGRR
jgi:16S rRNA (cytidine1402-2'-O)-methyltransferase